ncbi:MAG: hypothetical protein KBD78_10910 [Oligoflexales bacterium]|nr:hypothetical protein [Oligoflexales bacterium]
MRIFLKTFAPGLILISACSLQVKPSQQGTSEKSDANETPNDKDAHEEAKKGCISLKLTEPPLDYENVIKPLMNSKCAYCHSESGSPREEPYLATYNQVRNGARKSLEYMKKGEMPPQDVEAQLAAGDIKLLEDWIAAGMPKGVKLQIPQDDTSKLNYVQHIKPFLEANCKSCHGASATPPDLSTYEAAKTAALASRDALVRGNMPPGAPADTADVDAFQKWIDDGLLLDSTGATIDPNPSDPQPTCK